MSQGVIHRRGAEDAERLRRKSKGKRQKSKGKNSGLVTVGETFAARRETPR
jgi:hypothetical protein